MPLTALHDEFGVLDATLDDLGGAAGWEQVHKVRPRAPLTCRGCRVRLQAKVSTLGRRFFAHDAAVSTCPHNGETPAHRLLKSVLAAAIRAAGWTADLEVAGSGWRADVLGIGPDGRRFAWEAQLASVTAGDLSLRTATMLAELDGVCWVTDKDVPWVGRVPSIRIRLDEATNTLTVLDGAARFESEWCSNRWRCDDVGFFGLGGRPLPCRGHGQWEPPASLTLDAFVNAVCGSKIAVHDVAAWRKPAESRHFGGATVWTAACYVREERAQLDATETAEQRLSAYKRESAEHEGRIQALLLRQDALIKPTVDLVHRETGFYARVNADSQRSPSWAMGLPVYVPSGPCAVICPVESRIKEPSRSRLAPLLIIVADERERARVAAKCVPGQRILVIPAC